MTRKISRFDSAVWTPVASTVWAPLLRVSAYAVWVLVISSSSLVKVTSRRMPRHMGTNDLRRTPSAVRGIRVVVGSAVAVVAAACVPATEPNVALPPPGDVVTVASPATVGPLRIVGRDLIDAQGRRVLIHGTNMVIKASPWLPDETILSDQDLTNLRTDGFNAVRLGVWYKQLLPEVGVVDTAYLDRVESVVDRLTAAGLWVLLDFHQDLFWGMPDWATTPTAAALSAEHLPLFDWVGWAAAYTSPRSLQQWRDVVFDAPAAGESGRSIWDALSDGAVAMAQRFAGNDRVIGVELMNEPFPGEWYLECILQGCGWLENLLADHYDAMTARIRAVAPDMNVWWEPPVSAPGFGPTSMRAPSDDRVGFSWHAYCGFAVDSGLTAEASGPEVALCRGFIDNAFARASGRAGVWDRPMMMTEFGLSTNALQAANVTRAADHWLTSWFHWAADHYGHVFRADGDSRPMYAPAVQAQLTRVYPQATAGTPIALSFDPATGSATYRYAPDPTATGPTSLVVPAPAYPAGYDVAVTGGTVASAPDAGRLDLVANPGAAEVRVEVRRR